MTHSTLSLNIGKHAMLRSEGFEFGVVIMDAKQSYGQLRYAVTPEYGKGCNWVDAGRVRIVESVAWEPVACVRINCPVYTDVA